MADYKFKRNKDEEGYFIIEDGHTMFPEDVKKRLKRLSFLEDERLAMSSNAVLADVRLKMKQQSIYISRDTEYNSKYVSLDDVLKILSEHFS